MRQDEVDQRPALERAAEAVSDAERGLSTLCDRLASLVARGELSSRARATLNDVISGTDAALRRARAAIGEAAP